MKVHKSDNGHRVKRLTLELEQFPSYNSCFNLRFQSKSKLPGEQLTNGTTLIFQSIFPFSDNGNTGYLPLVLL